MRILVVEPHEQHCRSVCDALTELGHDPQSLLCADSASARCEDGLNLSDLEDPSALDVFDVVLGDLQTLHDAGLRRRLIGPGSCTPWVVWSDSPAVSDVVRVIKQGAFDFLTPPVPQRQLAAILSTIAHQQPSRAGGSNEDMDAEIHRRIIGASEGMRRVKRMIRIAARTDANVLLCGETGVGKDLLAATIHRLSHRSCGPFVKVGCALFPPSLIENELFGHQAGSYTGAAQSRPGRFELAQRGSIYLDDLDDIPLEQQAKLLRAIEEKIIERVGSTEPVKIDVRVIGSTKLNLLERVGAGQFREDLYYRLDVLRIRVPPLRDRTGDIPPLANHLLRQIAGDEPHAIEPAAMELLQQHSWPGNVRELGNALERAWLIGGGWISHDVLRETLADRGSGASSGSESRPTGFKQAMAHAEKQLLLNALEASGGNKTAAAESLGMKPSTFRDKLAKYSL